MAWTERYGTLATGTTSVTPSEPASTATGDILIATVVDKATSGTTGTTAPTGWTFLVAAAGTGGRIQIFYAVKGLGGLTGTSWTWTGLNTTSSAVIAGYAGGFQATPIDASFSARRNASGATGTTAITTHYDGEMIVAVFASLSNGATWSAEALSVGPTLTEKFDSANGTTQSIAIATGTQTTHGSTGTSSATMSANQNNAAALIGLLPDTAVLTGEGVSKDLSFTVFAPPVGESVSKDESFVVFAPPVGMSVSKDVSFLVLKTTPGVHRAINVGII